MIQYNNYRKQVGHFFFGCSEERKISQDFTEEMTGNGRNVRWLVATHHLTKTPAKPTA